MSLDFAVTTRKGIATCVVNGGHGRLPLGVCCCRLFCLILVGCQSAGSPETRAGRATLIERPTSNKFVLNSGADSDRGLARVSSRTNASKQSSEEPVTDAAEPVADRPDNRDEPVIFAEEGTRVSLLSSLRDARSQEPVVDRANFSVARQELTRVERQKEGTDAEKYESIADIAPSSRLTIPVEIPGSTAPALELPDTSEENRETRRDVIKLLFPSPPRVVSLPKSSQRPMTLEELEEIALQNSPIIVQSSAQITMYQGGAIQSGVYPNPVFGYESDTVGSSYTRNYQGIYTSQLVKTGGKLGLQRAVANMDLLNSQLSFQRTRLAVRHHVRAGYYNVLVAQEAMRINESLLRFMNEVFDKMVERMKDQQAPYETAQLRSLVSQARVTLNQSQNRYQSAWKQLAVATGIPDLRPAPLVDRVDMPVPNLDFEGLLNRTLNIHPDIEASRNVEAQSKLNLRLQRAIPIPDVTVAGVFQNDFTTPGFDRTSYNLNISVPVPIFDRNLGNIRTAEGRLQHSAQQLAVTRNDLTNQLADAFERYQTGRLQTEYYRMQVLPDLFRAYVGVYDAHYMANRNVAFGDIILAQQNLAVGVSVYVGALLQQWIAATDIANLTQLENFKELFDLPTAQDAPGGREIPQSPSTEGTSP